MYIQWPANLSTFDYFAQFCKLSSKIHVTYESDENWIVYQFRRALFDLYPIRSCIQICERRCRICRFDLFWSALLDMCLRKLMQLKKFTPGARFSFTDRHDAAVRISAIEFPYEINMNSCDWIRAKNAGGKSRLIYTGDVNTGCTFKINNAPRSETHVHYIIRRDRVEFDYSWFALR